MYTALRVLRPPADDPVPLELARRHCRIDTDYDDDLVKTYLAAAAGWAEAWLNRALVDQELRFTIAHGPPPTGAPIAAMPLVPQSLIVFPLNWPPLIRRPVALPRAPVRELLRVAVGAPEIGEPAPASHYTANLAVEPAQIMLHPGLLPLMPAMTAQFDFRAGYGAPQDVPTPIRQAVLLLTAFLYEGRGDIDSAGPSAAWALLAPYRLWSFAG